VEVNRFANRWLRKEILTGTKFKRKKRGGGILLSYRSIIIYYTFLFGVQLLGSHSSYKTEIHPIQIVRENLLKNTCTLNKLYNVDEDPVFFVESNVRTAINTYILYKG
jgi:hypothetical protein